MTISHLPISLLSFLFIIQLYLNHQILTRLAQVLSTQNNDQFLIQVIYEQQFLLIHIKYQ